MTEKPTGRTHVIGVFARQKNAALAIRELKRLEFTDEQLGIAAADWSEAAAAELQNKAEEGAIAGATVGGGIGAVTGALAASLIPGVGPILAGGVLAAVGAAGGSFVGPFLALEASKEDAERLAKHVQQGATVVIVRTEDRREAAEDVMQKYGAYDDSMRAQPRSG